MENWESPPLDGWPQRRERILAAKNTQYQQGFDELANEELARYTRRLMNHGKMLNTPELLNKRWANMLYKMIDGVGLKESNGTPHQHK